MDRQPHQAGTNEKRLPPGQSLTTKFPVLSYEATPDVDRRTWSFEVRGLVENPLHLSWDQFLAMAAATVTADFHCVTGWSRFDNRWEGLLVRDLVSLARPRPEAAYVTVHCYGGYTTNLLLDALLADDILVAHRHDGEDLHPDHGGPARLVVPNRYGYKSAKWVRGLELTARDKPGFWELNGYHSNADPWTEERYSL